MIPRATITEWGRLAPWPTADQVEQDLVLSRLIVELANDDYRSKGRDLFDLWVAITQLGIDPADLVSAFDPYRPDGYTSGRGIENLREKLTTPLFRDDLLPLVTDWPAGYRIEDAADLVIREILEQIA